MKKIIVLVLVAGCASPILGMYNPRGYEQTCKMLAGLTLQQTHSKTSLETMPTENEIKSADSPPKAQKTTSTLYLRKPRRSDCLE